jgi:hypothetical protein
MKNTMNEGQTQVYADGGLDPTAGIDSAAPYLNQPRQQLLDIIHVLFNQSGKMKPDGKGKIIQSGPMTDAQVLAILVGMGIPQQMALSGITKYKGGQVAESDIYTENNNQKNHNKMNFTLTDLYENVMESKTQLEAMDNDNSRVSYSVKDSLTILGEALNAFPMKLKNADLSLISEEIEKSANPNLKFQIARNLYTKLSASTWLNPISELREYIMESYNNAKWEFRISESIERTSMQKGKLIESLNNDLVSLLNESAGDKAAEEFDATGIDDIDSMDDMSKDVVKQIKSKKWKWLINAEYAKGNGVSFADIESYLKKNRIKFVFVKDSTADGDDVILFESKISTKSKFAAIAAKHPWSMDVKEIVNEMNAEDQKIASTANGKIVKVLSPVLESDKGLTFQLHGKNYNYDGKSITEANVTDPRFFDVSEGLKMFSRNGDILSLHGENGKTLTYDITEGTLNMGKIDLSNVSIIELKESLLATNFSGYRNQWQNDKICKFFESVDMVCELDEFTTVQSEEFADIFLTMIGVQEGIYLNKVNPGMGLNEMVKFDTATETVEVVKEFINFDISPVLTERLLAENNEKAIVENKRKDLSDALTFLEEKKSEVEEAIKKLGETEELSEALNLLGEELKNKEKELADSYISEKKSKDDYLNDGYVEATVAKASQGLKKDQEVLVSAEEYASLGDDDLLTIMVPKTGKSIVLPKGDLDVKI